MLFHWAKLGVCILSVVVSTSRAETPLFSDDFETLDQWVVEQMPGGRVEVGKGRMHIVDRDGCTVWFRTKLTQPVSIQYDAIVRSDGRVSDLNCFWMASDPANPADLFASGNGRSGAFKDYDCLQTYYVGFGGNNNSTTRFRRYEGGGNKPLLPQYDLRARPFLLTADHVYRIELRAKDGVIEFVRDGEIVFTYQDRSPLTEGWFGIRTVNAHLEITRFRIFPMPKSPTVTDR